MKTARQAVTEVTKASLRTLPRSLWFCVVLFGSDARTLASTPGLVPANETNVSAACRDLDIARRGAHRGTTNLHGGLRRAFGVTLTGTGDGRSVFGADPITMLAAGATTMFVLTDGVPSRDDWDDTANLVTGKPWYADVEAIVEDVTRMNLLRGCELHAVALGTDARAVLEPLARVGGGQVRVVEGRGPRRRRGARLAPTSPEVEACPLPFGPLRRAVEDLLPRLTTADAGAGARRPPRAPPAGEDGAGAGLDRRAAREGRNDRRELATLLEALEDPSEDLATWAEAGLAALARRSFGPVAGLSTAGPDRAASQLDVVVGAPSRSSRRAGVGTWPGAHRDPSAVPRARPRVRRAPRQGRGAATDASGTDRDGVGARPARARGRARGCAELLPGDAVGRGTTDSNGALPMRRLLPAVLAVALVAAAALSAAPARADGFLVPIRPERRVRGDWAVTYHHVDVNVVGQKARVRVDQEFTNLSSIPLETEYVFPVPAGAMVNAVTLMVDGKAMEGRLLKAEEARRIYDDIVRRQKDPALVEYVGRDFFRASIFPIPAGGSRQLVLEYDQLLPKDGETVELVYPLNTEKFSAKPLRDVRVTVEVASETGVGAVYCPSHDVVVTRKDGKHLRATMEAKQARPETDFLLYWGEQSGDVSATLLTHWPRGEDRGYFLLLAAPSVSDAKAEAVKPKDITFCVDVSGSMAGVVFEQTRAALRQVIGGLNEGDVFNVITYSSDVVALWDVPRKATKEALKEAFDFVEGLRATGGTRIVDAFKTALTQPSTPGLPRVLLFLTDGRPTIGETTDPDEIVKRVAAWNQTAKASIFTFGLGTTVNAAFLDRIALGNHGAPAYVRPGEDVERKVAALYEKLRYPVLTDVKLDFGGLQVSGVLPGVMPDLFRGGQVVVAGRFKKGGGPVDVVLSGRDGETGREFHYKLQAGGEGQGLRDDFPARVWARAPHRRTDRRHPPRRPPGEGARGRDRRALDEVRHHDRVHLVPGGRDRRPRLARREPPAGGRGAVASAQAADRDDAGGFAQAANQAGRPHGRQGAPAARGRGGPVGRPAVPRRRDVPAGDGLSLLKQKEGGRDVEELKVGVVRQVGNRAFYNRARVQARAAVWVDAEVKDASQGGRGGRRAGPRGSSSSWPPPRPTRTRASPRRATSSCRSGAARSSSWRRRPRSEP